MLSYELRHVIYIVKKAQEFFLLIIALHETSIGKISNQGLLGNITQLPGPIRVHLKILIIIRSDHILKRIALKCLL